MKDENLKPFQFHQPFNIQNSMINEGLVSNPSPGFTNQQQMLAPAQNFQAAVGNNESVSAVQSYQRFPECDMLVGNCSRRRKSVVEGTEEAMEVEKLRKIKKRATAAKFRAKKLAQRAQLKEKLVELEEENAHIKQLQAEAIRKRRKEMEEEMKERRETKAENTAERFRTLRRTLSSPW